MKTKKKAKKPRVAQWVRIVVTGRGNYSVIFADAFGRVHAYDIHGPQLVTAFPPFSKRTLRLDHLMSQRSFERLGRIA